MRARASRARASRARASRARNGLRRAAIVVVAGVAAVVLMIVGGSGLYLGWDRIAPVRPAVVPGGFTLEAAGVPTHVEHWPAARPRGLPPLVLVPGFAESTYVWSRTAPLLAADRDVYAYDVRGYGVTDPVPPYTLDADTDQLAGLVTALGLTRPVVVGHSSGVAIALSLALRAPATVTGVVAVSGDGTPYFGTGPADRIPRGPGPRTLLLPPVAPAVVTAVVRHRDPIRGLVTAQCGPGCPVDDAAIDRWRAPFLRPGAVDAFVAILRRPLIGLTDDQERTIGVPTALVYSGDDTSFDRAGATATASRLHSRAVVGLDGARHLALLGEPERVAAALGEGLRAVDPAGR